MYLDCLLGSFHLENITDLLCLPEVCCDLRGWFICQKPTLSRYTSLQENQSEKEARETGIKAILLLAGACWVGEQGNGDESRGTRSCLGLHFRLWT